MWVVVKLKRHILCKIIPVQAGIDQVQVPGLVYLDRWCNRVVCADLEIQEFLILIDHFQCKPVSPAVFPGQSLGKSQLADSIVQLKTPDDRRPSWAKPAVDDFTVDEDRDENYESAELFLPIGQRRGVQTGDLIKALDPEEPSRYLLEEVFSEIAEEVDEFEELNLSKITDLGIPIMKTGQSIPLLESEKTRITAGEIVG